MPRQYVRHGLGPIVKRQTRRRGAPDGRTRISKEAEAARAAIVAEHGGQDQVSTMFLINVQIGKHNIAAWTEIAEANERYKMAHPKIRENPKALATLESYLKKPEEALVRLSQLIGIDLLPLARENLDDWKAKELAKQALIEQDDTQAAQVDQDSQPSASVAPGPQSAHEAIEIDRTDEETKAD